jgi:bifunctional lysine-specific demethylase and histidyl-hydroxylase NO66
VSSGSSALQRLVADVPSFLTDRFGTRPLYVEHADDEGFADLLSLDDVDRIVAGSGLRAPAFRLVRDGATLPTAQVTKRARIGSRPVTDLVDVRAVHEAFAAGATLVLQGLHRSWAPVAQLCRQLELALTHPTQANAYLTPPVAQGLDLHADPHDVFAIQTHGTKRWVVHPPGSEAPWDLVLRPGDVLYLPAGTRHAAQTTDEPSLHLTVGVRPARWRDLLRRAVDGLLDDPTFAAPLPAGWADDPAASAGTLQARLADLREALATLPAEERCAAEAASFHASRPPDLTGGLRDRLELDTLGDTTRLRRRPGTTCRIEPGPMHLEVALGDRRLRMPATLAASMARILDLDRFRPEELDDLLDGPSRLVLCRRLVREGLLTFDRERPEGRDG